jgi:hypothetical protein
LQCGVKNLEDGVWHGTPAIEETTTLHTHDLEDVPSL